MQDDEISIFDLEEDEALEAALIAKARAEFEAGLGVPHEKVRVWLLQLAEGKRVPPPTA